MRRAMAPVKPIPQDDFEVQTRAEPDRILIVEDEVVVAMLIEDMVTELGYQVGAMAAHVGDAIALVERDSFDFAILDVHLNGKEVFPLADILMKRRIPFMFATAFGARGIPPAYVQYPVLQKPFSSLELKRALLRLRQS